MTRKLRQSPFFCLLAVLACAALCCGAIHAQTAATTPATPKAALPDSPSSKTAAGATMTAGLPMVNGRPYRKPTAHEDLIAFRQELIGPRPFISAAVRAGIEQARTVPVGWGQDFPGYLQRYGSAYGEAAIDSSVRYAMGAALHEDVRYLICHHCSFGDKFENAVLAEVTARHGADGHRVVSPTPLVSGFSGPLIAYTAWYPPGYDPGMAARHAALGFSTRILFHLVREVAFDHDTKAEKAAKKAAAAQP